MAQRAQLVLDFIPQLSAEKLNVIIAQLKKSLGSLGNDIELIDVDAFETQLREVQVALDRVNTDDLQREINAVVEETQKAANDINKALSNINTDELQKGLQDAANEYDKFTKEGNNDSAKKGVTELAASFAQARNEISATIGTQKQALAALALAGKSGTQEFENLAQEIKKNQNELESLKTAAESVEKALSDVPQKSGVDAITDDYKKLRSELATTIAAQKESLGALSFAGKSGTVEFAALQKQIRQNQEELNKLEEAAKEAEKSLSDIPQKSRGDELADEFTASRNALASLVEQQKKALAGLAATGGEGSDEFKNLRDEIVKNQTELKKLDDVVSTIDEELSKLSQTTKDDSFLNIAAKFEALGSAGETLKGFAERGVAARDAMFNLAAQTGASTDELANLEAAAERAFKAGVGGSLQDAIKAIGTGKQLLGNFLDTKGIEDFTKQAAAIGQVFDKDVNEVIAGSRTFIAQFGLEGKQAADLVGLAMQEGGSKMDDVLDTLDEYSQLTKQAGFSAEEFVGVLTTGMQAGVRDTDKLADAIKETQIRLNAGDTAKALLEIQSPISNSIRSIVALGEQGKISVKEVLQQSAAQIKEAFDAGTISAAVRDQLGTALSGTMAEDIGGEMYTTIFSQPIDKKAIAERAAEAGAQIQNALGPVTLFEKVNKELEFFAIKASESFAPFIAGAGEALQSTSQLAPALTLVKDAIPKESLDALIEKTGTLKKSLTDSLGSNDLLKKVDGLKGKFSELGPALSNPVTIGVGVGVAALTYFFTQTDEGRKQFAQLEESAKDFFTQLEPVFDGAGKIFGNFVGTVIQLGEAFATVFITPLEIVVTVLSEIDSLFGSTETSAKGATSTIDTAAGALQKVAEWLAVAGKAIGNFSDGFKVGKEQLLAFIRGSEQILGAFGEFAVTALNPANWFDGDASAAKAKLSKILDETVGKAAEEAKTKLAAANLSENLTEALTLKTDLDKNKKLDELVKKFNSTKDAAEKANIAEQIQKQVPGAVKALGSVVDAQGKIIGQYDISTQKVQEYAKAQEAASGDKLKTKQAEIVKGIEAQSNAYAETIKKQKELADEIVKDTAAGKDTAALKKKYDEITKTAQEETTKLKDAIEKGADVGVQFSDAKISPAFQAEFDAKLGELREKATKAEIGKAITEASQIKENLDKQDKIGELVKKFKSASTDVEKNYFAKKIGEQMPGVVKETIKGVDANGKLVKSYELATDQVDKQLAATTRLYSGDLRSKQVQYVDAVKKEGASYQDNLKKVESLGKEIEKKKALGVDTTKLEKDLKAAQTNVVESQKKVLLMGADFEKMGLKSGAAISEIAKALNVSEKEAKRLLEAQTGLSKEAKLSAAEIGKLAESYTAAINNISNALQNGIGAAAEIKRQNEELALKAIKLQQELDKLKVLSSEQDVKRREEAKAELQATEDQITKNNNNLKQLREDNKNAAREAARLRARQSREEEAANEKTLKGRLTNFGYQQDAAEFAKIEFENDQKRLILQQRRAETEEDQLLVAQKAFDIDQKQLKNFQAKFDAQGKITSALFESADAAKGFEQAIGIAFSSFKEIGNKDEAKALVQQLQSLVERVNAARDNRNKLLVDVQIDPLALQRQLLDFDKARLEIQVDVGYITDENANKERQQILQRELNLTIKQNDNFVAAQKKELERINKRIAEEEKKAGKDLFEKVKLLRKEQAQEKSTLEANITDFEALDRVEEYVKNYEDLTRKLLEEDAKKGKERNELLIGNTKKQIEELGKNLDLGTTDSAVLQAYIQDAESRTKALVTTQQTINKTADLNLIDNYGKQAKVIQLAIEERGRQTKLAEERTAADIVKLKRELNAKELAALQKDIDAQQKLTERQLELFERTLAAFTGSSAKLLEQRRTQANSELDSEFEKRKKQLDKLKGTVSDDALARRQEQLQKEQQKRREDLEKDHQRRLANISALAEGQRLAASREADVQRLREMQRVKQKEYEFATESGDKKASERLATELIDLNDTLSEKGDILRSSVGDLQNAITEGLGNLFAGDPEAAKEPFRKLFGVISGALSKLASAVVIDTVLKWLEIDPSSAALPLPIKLGLIPVVTGVVQAGISALLAPAINSLTSFASGGRVDEPTLALVGDGAKLGESNREWIFRDQQLQQVVYQAANTGNNDIVQRLDNVILELQSFSGRIRVTEREIYEAGNKERSRVSRRAR